MFGLDDGVVMSADHPRTPPGKTTVPPMRAVDRGLLSPLRPVVCPPVCFEGQLRVESPFEVASPLAEVFGDDEGRH